MAHFIAINKIVVKPSRQRKVFSEASLQELGDSIEANQLLHPIVLREENGEVVLVAGECRLRAITDLTALGRRFAHNGGLVPEGQIPYTTLGELSAIEAMEAELEENIRRTDISWQERAAATATLFELRSLQAETAGSPAPTPRTIAEELHGSGKGSPQENVRRELILSKHLDNPEVQKAKSVDEAFKTLKKQEIAKRNEALGHLVGKTLSSADLHMHNINCLDYFAEATPEQFDVLLTDPPYGMGADDFGDSGGKTEGAHSYVDSKEVFLDLIEPLARESFRLAKPQAHAYVFCDFDGFHQLRASFAAAGWKVFRTPLIWYKPQAFRAPWPEQGPQRKYELIMYAVKGDKPVTHLYGDVITCQPDANLGHMAQKPVALLTDLLRRSVIPGNRVFDPFAGSGSSALATFGMKCSFVGCEIDPTSYGLAVSRIQQLDAQKELAL